MRAPRWRSVDGILLLDKPVGVSSNQALQIVRRALRAAKGGHTGSLDVAASGLLPLCFGEATKVCAFLLDADKRYRAEIRLGRTTTTGDREGTTTATCEDIPTSAEAVTAALAGFKGKIAQVPPMFSALKRHGQPLYKLARKGLEVERAPRTVRIHHLELVHYETSVVTIDVRCSKGTYIRSLAVDLGEVLGCGAHLAALHRLEAGPFAVTSAHPLELFANANDDLADFVSLLVPADQALSKLPAVTLAADDEPRMLHGQAIKCRESASAQGLVRIYGATGHFLGVGFIGPDARLEPRRLMRAGSV